MVEEPQRAQAMPLGELTETAPRGANPLVTGVTANSRLAGPGDLFAALPGTKVHGATFAPAAVAQGAVAIYTDAAGAEIIAGSGIGAGFSAVFVNTAAGAGSGSDAGVSYGSKNRARVSGTSAQVPENSTPVPVVVAQSPQTHLGELAAKLYGYPAHSFLSCGVTGTNGKTTTAYILDFLLRQAEKKPALIGTVEVRVGGETVPAHLTTPMPDELQKLLATHRQWGGDALVMEVSSHALAQGRTDPICFDVAGFTNLSQDHLDFHQTMESYYQAKRTFFTPQRARRAVIRSGSEWGKRLLREAEIPATQLILPGEESVPGFPTWEVTRVQPGQRTQIALRSPAGEEHVFSTSLPGSFNVENVALAVAMAAEAGVDIRPVLAGGVDPVVPGRMEIISQQPRVVVDFAHNTAALENAMAALRDTVSGKFIVLTGSAGERDADKRPAMGRAVAAAADLVYITDDDPHEEDPAQIRADLLRGTAAGPARVIEIPDRREAIHAAICDADAADTVLLAGRGHETHQPVRGGEVELDDRVEARRALTLRENRAAREEAGAAGAEGAARQEAGAAGAEGAARQEAGATGAEGAGTVGHKGDFA
ncbi:Mur ligase family protein [Actinobaculum suis]|uniref:Mur ligase family protein n=1 Tax=Actinobaculum suis TaxID=1657 RepID=UPI00080881CE|nr:UDP-N-acetylmuramoyl-L-alanyl-D-glutamate--2,6-diaminopimelate ligase [Actinobaculum suis]OCA93312.1 hypothetical protein ACU20_02050 [Actinobaculum suis]OCA94465.1 hypothetical protein ACU21_07125 [Actinobaculum suis]